MISSTRLRRALVVVAASLVAASAIAEVVVRATVTSRIADRAARLLATEPDVAAGGTPVLVQLAGGGLGTVRVSTAGATFRGLSGLAVGSDLIGLRREHGTVRIDEVLVRAEVPAATLADAIGAELGIRAEVVFDPDAGELIVRTGPAGLIGVMLRPGLAGSEIRFELVGTTFAGRSLPGERMPRAADLSGLPLDLAPTALAVTDDGLDLELAGDNVIVPA